MTWNDSKSRYSKTAEHVLQKIYPEFCVESKIKNQGASFKITKTFNVFDWLFLLDVQLDLFINCPYKFRDYHFLLFPNITKLQGLFTFIWISWYIRYIKSLLMVGKDPNKIMCQWDSWDKTFFGKLTLKRVSSKIRRHI